MWRDAHFETVYGHLLTENVTTKYINKHRIFSFTVMLPTLEINWLIQLQENVTSLACAPYCFTTYFALKMSPRLALKHQQFNYHVQSGRIYAILSYGSLMLEAYNRQ